MSENFYIIVPFFNEEKWLPLLLNSLKNQIDSNFKVILVDNNSTDHSCEVISHFINETKINNLEVIKEIEKGTGAALSTGFKYAIKCGATLLARTDADCALERNWVKKVKKYFNKGYLFIGGIQFPLKDNFYKWHDNIYGKYVPYFDELGATISLGLRYRDPKNKYFYKHIVGTNMAITKDLYLKTGGFPRTKIEDVHEDFYLSEKVRKISTKVKKSWNLKTYVSLRRLRTYGRYKTQEYYLRKYKPEIIDIR